MYNDIIKAPTQELLDNLMLEIVEKTEESNDIERRFYESEYNLQKLIDLESDREVDGKKVHRYKTDAEKSLRNTQAYEIMIDHKIKKKENERNLSLLNQIYYHARGKITDNRLVDTRASQHGTLHNQ